MASLVNTLATLRNAKRAVKLREEGLTDEETFGILEDIINNALLAQASGNSTLMQKSISEMRQVRNDSRVGRINLRTPRQQQMLNRFSGMVDQLEEAEQKNKGPGVVSQAAGRVASSLPSSDTIISAVMTANPLLGYGIKMLRDLGGSFKSSQQQQAQQVQEQGSLIEQQRDYVLAQEDNTEAQQEVTTQSQQLVSDSSETSDNILTRVSDAIVDIRDMWREDRDVIKAALTRVNSDIESGDETQAQLISSTHETINATTEQQNQLMRDNTDSTNEILSQMVDTQNDSLDAQRRAAEQAQFASTENMRESGGGGLALALPDAPGGDKKGGILGGLTRMLGGIGLAEGIGIGAILTAMKGKLKTFFTGIGRRIKNAFLAIKNTFTGISLSVTGIKEGVGKLGRGVLKIGKFLGRMNVWLAPLFLAFDAIDGYMNAEEIFDKEEVTSLERKSAAASNSIWNYLDFMNDILSFVSFGFLGWDIDEDKLDALKKRSAEGFRNMAEMGFSGIIDNLFEGISNWFMELDMVKEVGIIKDKIVQYVKDLISSIPDLITGAIGRAGDYVSDVADSATNKVKDVASNVAEGSKNFFNDYIVFWDNDEDNDGRNSPVMMMEAPSASRNMTGVFSQYENESNRARNDGSAAIIAGNNNTSVTNNNISQVRPMGNTSNNDNSVRTASRANTDRLTGN